MLSATPKPNTRQCAQCGKPFQPQYTSMQQVCSIRCSQRLVKNTKAARVKAERQETKERKKALETIPDLIKAAQKEFNAYIRERDRNQPCICCGRPLGEGDIGGAYDCGHYRSTGSAPHLRFHEHNAHAQRKQCNRYGAGRAVDYRIGLIERIGVAAVEAIESDNRIHKWTREELREIAAKYRALVREMKKAKAE